ncbi:MAG: 1-deoxy-D-xylulose-5-phosphate synthase [Paludibacteraceae bacterium]
MYIENINSPADVKKLSLAELEVLGEEMRHFLLKKLSEHGGHIGPNLGMVEATIALHYVFDSPTDKFVFDVSHQSYAHKMLTGRKDGFLNPKSYDEISGYSCPAESEHDFFEIGHTSTSISLATGLAKARDVKGDDGNVIAIIGDGSLSGGEAFEGLNNAAELNSNFIIVFNDNEMSIAENHGGMYRNLKELRDSKGSCSNNLFKAMGMDYVYVEEGNDVAVLIDAFRKVKDIDRPIVVHIHTLKGKGYAFAEQNKEAWHWGFPFNLETGESSVQPGGPDDDYACFTAGYLLRLMRLRENLVVLTAGTPTVGGFTPDKRAEAGSRFVDVGIAEEHAAAMASGLAKAGCVPVWPVYGTFIQRAYDQISQDICINKSPVVMLVFCASVYGMNDVTHLGLYDIPLLSNIPNLVYLAPTSKNDYFAMLEWAVRQKDYPVAIRVPGNGMVRLQEFPDADYDYRCYKMRKKGSRVAVLALGSFFQLGEGVVDGLKDALGIEATLINPRFITGLDADMLERLKSNHEVVVTLEDGILDGGFGEKIARFYGPSAMKVLCFGIKKAFYDRYDVNELLKDNHLTVPQIVDDVKQILEQSAC